MSTTRRHFLGQFAALGAACLSVRASARHWLEPIEPQRRRRLLILGGTGFLGPHVVEHARRRGHTLTLFNRGRTNPHLFPDVEKLQGDRNGDLDALKGREWDAVLDTSGYVRQHVTDSATLLKDAVEHYIFISTISVYPRFPQPGMDESAPTAVLPEGVEESTRDVNAHFGALKALCEREAERIMPGRVANIRPGLIVGPGDPTDRFTYWPVRLDRGGEVLAPGTADDPVQFIDARDLAEWIVRVVEERIVGVFNATGPREPLGIAGLLEACRAAAGSDATLTWIDADFLREQGVSAWSDLPVWSARRGDMTGFAQVSAQRAIERGLTFRPVVETARETLAWWKGLPDDRRARPRAGLSPEREAAVLTAWRERG